METRVFLMSLIPVRKQFPNLTKREIEILAGNYVVKKVFSKLFGYETIEINRIGKPYIEGCPYQFNISHSGDWLLLAVGDVPIGADIEKITKIRPKTMEKFFTLTEQERVSANGAEEFFKIWTQKESYVKFTGEGIKGVSKKSDYPEEIAFFSKKHEHYQITVCTEKNHLPKNVEILSYLL